MMGKTQHARRGVKISWRGYNGKDPNFVLFAEKKCILNKIKVYPIITPNEIIAPHFGIINMIGGAICYLTTKLGAGGYNGKDPKIILGDGRNHRFQFLKTMVKLPVLKK